MAARKVNTPGATPKPEEVKATEATQPTTAEQAEQAEAALESITGADPSTNENAPEALESKPAEVKRTQNVLTERGWDSVEG